MKYAFFPGCSLESTAWDFDRSTRAVCRALGIELEEIPNWVCCGSTPAHTQQCVAGRGPAGAEPAEGRGDGPARGDRLRLVLRPAADGQSHGSQRAGASASRPSASPASPTTARSKYTTCWTCWSIISAWTRSARRCGGLWRVSAWPVITAACSRRPPEVVAFDNSENPTCMDDLVAAMDAEPVDWPYKTECCGASLSITQQRRGLPAGPQTALHGPAGRRRLPRRGLSVVPAQSRLAAGRCPQGRRRTARDAGSLHHAAFGACFGALGPRSWPRCPERFGRFPVLGE